MATEKITSISALKALAQQLKNKIPVKVSELANDSKFQTEEQVAAAVASADHLKRRIVDSVDDIDLTADDAAQYIYMVLKGSGKNGDKYDEYMVLDGAVEKVGDWTVDLSGYVQKEDGKGLSSNDFTDEEKAKLAAMPESIAEASGESAGLMSAADKEKLDSLETASDEEVAAMLAEVFGTPDAE